MENQKKIKSFSKVLHVIAVLARVCMYFTAVLLVLFAVLIPILFSKVDIDKNRLAIVGIPEAKVEVYKDETEKLNILFNDKKVNIEKELTETEQSGVELIFDMATKTTKNAVIGYLEASAIFSLVIVVIIILAIKNFEKFTKNLKDNDEVFGNNNSNLLRNSAKFLLIAYIVSLVSSAALSGAINDNFGFNINTINLIEIISLYMLSYIFAYGHSLEVKKVEVVETKEKKVTRKKATKKEEK